MKFNVDERLMSHYSPDWRLHSSSSALLATIALALSGMTGNVSATPIFNETFTTTTLNNPLFWVHNYMTTAACLTAATASQSQGLAVGTLTGCQATAIDSAGSGALRLTPVATTGVATTMLYDVALPTSGGLDISFNIAQYGGSPYHADGIGFFLKDGSNANNSVGASGGALGYALSKSSYLDPIASHNGVPGGLFGIGFDVYGNYSRSWQGLGCPNPEGSSNSIGLNHGGTWSDLVSNVVAIRGPDLSPSQNGSTGFCYLGGTSKGAVSYSGSTRALAARAARVVVDPYTVVPDRKITVYIGGEQVLQVPVPTAFINAPTFKFGFSGTTGTYKDIHEVWGMTINSVLPMATLRVTKQGTGVGMVTSMPAGISCGPEITCGGMFNLGTGVTLSARSFPGSVFTGWTGGCSSTSADCLATLYSDKAVTATFRYGGSSTSYDLAQDLYVAYYGRPADPEGRAYWAGQADLAGGFNAVVNAFGASAEFTRRYAGLTNEAMVTKIYQQTLNRDPDAAGLAWYVGELQAGRQTFATVALAVLSGAFNPPDSTVIANKGEVADYYTAKLVAGCTYGTEQIGIDFLTPVTADRSTVTAAKAVINSRCGT